MACLIDLQLLLCNKSHGIHQPFSRTGDDLHSQTKVRMGVWLSWEDGSGQVRKGLK